MKTRKGWTWDSGILTGEAHLWLQGNIVRENVLSYTIHRKEFWNFFSCRGNILSLWRCWIDSTSQATCSSAPLRFTRNQSSDLWWLLSLPQQMIFSRTGTSSQIQPPLCWPRRKLLTDGESLESNSLKYFSKLFPLKFIWSVIRQSILSLNILQISK